MRSALLLSAFYIGDAMCRAAGVREGYSTNEAAWLLLLFLGMFIVMDWRQLLKGKK